MVTVPARGYLPGMAPATDETPAPPTPEPGGSPARSLPRPPPGYVPGQKRAKHLRNARIATGITIAALVLFAVFLVLMLTPGDTEEPRLKGTRRTLEGLAAEVRGYRERHGRLPAHLRDLFSPDSPSTFDAEPPDMWKRPVDYRVVDEAKGDFRLRSKGADGKADTPDDVVWPPGATWR